MTEKWIAPSILSADFARLGEETFFPTLGAAVKRYLNTYPVEWRDWKHGNP